MIYLQRQQRRGPVVEEWVWPELDPPRLTPSTIRSTLPSGDTTCSIAGSIGGTESP